ncbi:MAG: DUF3179 domain-containing protein [Acidobacteriota bacterium]|nr:MAG: DUF3179 domain-containing protein [Acidobacteriota bacterium]
MSRTDRIQLVGRWVVGVAFLLAGFAAPALAQRPEPEVFGTFDGAPMYTVLPAGAIPAILEPWFVSGDAAHAQMRAEEPVLGIVHHGEAKAYSLWQLDAHETVNDVIGDTPIAASW